MPLTVASNLTAAGTTSPTVSTDLVVHLPEEIVTEARAAEREQRGVVVCCRGLDQATMLADKILLADVGSAVLAPGTDREAVNAIVEAFGYGDFTVLLVVDDLGSAWQVSDDKVLLHADLPALHGSVQFMNALNVRRSRLRSGIGVA